VKTLAVLLLLSSPVAARALDVCLPTANNALLRPGHDAEFFQPTVEGSTETGMFGCMRRDGRRFHEGIDIKCLQRDRRGEPTDPVHSVADGEIAFINAKPGLSNYGRYIVLKHRWDGVEVFTLYAHLREIAAGLVIGQPVRKGQVIAVLGHSTNTREGISAERAHLHFEINFMLNTGFRVWFPKREPKAPPFGNFNGQNLIGLDPAAFYRAYAGNPKLSFADYVARQPVGFTVLVNARPFPWLAIHPEQIQPGTATPVAYEIAATAWGLPVAVWPRAGNEVSSRELRALARSPAVVHRVNESELDRSGCRKLVIRSGRVWQLGTDGREWAELLTYQP
jgi:murein DD-endopeptidase MepM/ murein hydrolase activator NlpD